MPREKWTGDKGTAVLAATHAIEMTKQLAERYSCYPNMQPTVGRAKRNIMIEE